MASAYCTLDQLKASLSLTSPNTSSDELLEDVIDSVSRAIDAYCGTQFFAAAQVRHFTASLPYCLAVDDLLAVTTLKTDNDGDGVYENTWAAGTDYVLEPANAQLESEPRPYWRVEVRINGGHFIFPVGISRGVELDGSWGAASSTPAQVHIVALREAIHYFHAIRSPYGSGGPGGAETQGILPIGLSRSSLRDLAPYRRIPVG